MAPSVLYASALASIASIAAATGTLSLSLDKKSLEPEEIAFLRKRSGGTVQENTFDVFPWSGGGAYYTNVTVGTPPQVITVILDSGSSDLYFDASSSSSCQDTSSDHTCRGGSFNPSDSSTYKVLTPNGFNTSFGDGSTATGDYSSDVVGVGDVQISNVEFGVASFVNSTTGFAVSLMGVGYSANEAGAITGQGAVYPNMPEVLQQAGVINSRLYSVYLNQLGTATGNILFGGIDTSMYTGELHTMDILPVAYPDQTTGQVIQVVYQFVVPITGISANANGKTTTILQNANVENEIPVLLDTGSAAWIVPPTVFSQIAKLFPDLNAFQGTIPCSSASNNVTINIEFGGGVTIEVPSSSIIVPYFSPSNNQPQPSESGSGDECIFMIQPDQGSQMLSQQGFLIAGDAVLRSAYVVFDLDNGQISLAQANDSPGSSNVKAVPAGADGVASAVGSSNVATAAPNSASIAPEITASVSFSASTVSPAVATATGEDAVPENGRVTLSAAFGSGGSTGLSGSSPTGKSAAATVRPQSTGYLPVLAFWLASAVFGFGFYLW